MSTQKTIDFNYKVKPIDNVVLRIHWENNYFKEIKQELFLRDETHHVIDHVILLIAESTTYCEYRGIQLRENKVNYVSAL